MTLKSVKKRNRQVLATVLIYLPLYIMSSFTIVSLIYLFRDFCLKLIRKTLLALSVSIFDVEQISIMRLQTYWTTPLLGPTEIPAHSIIPPLPLKWRYSNSSSTWSLYHFWISPLTLTSMLLAFCSSGNVPPQPWVELLCHCREALSYFWKICFEKIHIRRRLKYRKYK